MMRPVRVYVGYEDRPERRRARPARVAVLERRLIILVELVPFLTRLSFQDVAQDAKDFPFCVRIDVVQIALVVQVGWIRRRPVS